jgi:beta-lactamase class D
MQTELHLQKLILMKKLITLFCVLPPTCFILFTGCNHNNVSEDNSLKKFFDENNVTGSFGLFNNGTGKFTIYNLARYRDSAYLPASTFKIINSLIGLQTGKIADDSMVIKWDGVIRIYPGGDTATGWNKDLNMYDAFRASSVPYYQEVARRIGKDTMQRWLNTLHYAAGVKDTAYKIRSAIDTFWLDNSMKITADEQLYIVKNLYFRSLNPFFKTYQDIVKRAMIIEQNTHHTLAYKTGWGKKENGNHLGWIVGWIEEDSHPYFFVLNIESSQPDFDMVTVRKKILLYILKSKGFLNTNK